MLQSFYYASSCSHQYSLGGGGIVPSRPLTTHLYVAQTMANHPLSPTAITVFTSDGRGLGKWKGDHRVSLWLLFQICGLHWNQAC